MKYFASLFLFLFSCTASLHAQAFSEYIARLNPLTAGHLHVTQALGPTTVIASTAYDDNNNRFFFSGRNSMQGWNFYVVDVMSGTTLFQNQQTTSTALYSTGLVYDNSTDTLYGLYVNGNTGTYSFAWIDPATTVTYVKSVISNLNYTDGYRATLDEQNHRYIFVGTDANGQERLFVINARTGTLISSSVLQLQINDMHYNNNDNHLYAIVDSTWVGHKLDTIEVNTGIGHEIGSLPWEFGLGRETAALNETAGEYVFVGRIYDSQIMGFRDSLYTVDIQSAAVVNRVLYPYDPSGQVSNMENILGYQFDDSLNVIYGIHWGENPKTDIWDAAGREPGFTVHPNPAADQLSIYFERMYESATVTVTDLAGKQVMQTTVAFNQQVQLDCSALAQGVYMVAIIGDGEKVGTRKVIVE